MFDYLSYSSWDRRCRDRIHGSWIYNYLCNQVPITSDVVSLNLDQGEVYNIM